MLGNRSCDNGSAMQMEVTFDSMQDWEVFLSQIPFQKHRAWSQQIQSMVVDGSPRWEVLRSCAALPDDSPASASAPQSANALRPGTVIGTPQTSSNGLVFADKVREAWNLHSAVPLITQLH